MVLARFIHNPLWTFPSIISVRLLSLQYENFSVLHHVQQNLVAQFQIRDRVLDPLQETQRDLARVVVLPRHGGPGILPVPLTEGVRGDLALTGTPAQG